MDAAEFNRVKQWLAVFFRGLFVIGSVFALTLWGGRFAIDEFRHKTYAATAVIQAVPPPADGQIPDSIQSFPDDPDSGSAQVGVIRSPTILTPVLRDLNLESIWKKRLFPSRDAWGEKDALAHLEENLKVEPKRGTLLIVITFRSDLPIEAAEVANAIAAEYKLKRDSGDVERTNAAKDSINAQIDQQQQLVDAKKAALDLQKEKSSVVVIQPGLTPGVQDPPDLADYHAAERDLARQRTVLDSLILHLREVMDIAQNTKSSVRIIAPAKAPEKAFEPNRAVARKIVLVLAILLSLGVGSSVEIVFLLLRAAKRSENF